MKPTPRDLVRAASAIVEDPFTRSWLFSDERGTFEAIAKRLLEHEETFERYPEKAREQAAEIIALQALTAASNTRRP